MTTKEFENSNSLHSQQLLKKPQNMTYPIRQLSFIYHKPNQISGPGLPPIKQVDLFTKWRQIVPFEYKDITFPEPSQEIKDKAKTDKSKNKKDTSIK